MTEFTPAACQASSQRLIGDYIQQVGAFGDPEKVRKALEMLISSAALGYGFVSNQLAVIDLLLRTSMHVAQRMEDGDAYPETVQ
ncbi:hypothetical protein [Achromobacter aegrifaciens]|uniref:Uncharacterized protein n=1 Tax=Achromobacter aegrifaciens TaxID=1287736 RepID=A0AAD2KJY7_ACHAE|nr:hypothetical protein [Achromobacter aegrifaciens]CUJ01576.1 Uncharacterised protein [Achromobacter aegrifaciens]